MAATNDTIDGLLAEFRGYSAGMPASYHVTMSWADFRKMLDRFDAAHRREAQNIERIVRDAIIDYNGMYPSAPNDEAERDLRERAARANAWLKQHGFEEESFHWSKEETPCL